MQIFPHFLKVDAKNYYLEGSLDKGFSFVLQESDTYPLLA